MNEPLAVVGRIHELNEIKGADFIVSATVVCGSSGKWRGVVKKQDFQLGDKCLVLLPDAQVEEGREGLGFLKDSGWRVKMRRFKGSPSECVILLFPLSVPMLYLEGGGRVFDYNISVGDDLTEFMGVTRYIKPVPAHLNGDALGLFPDFIPKTDEPNYQREEDMVRLLEGKFYYISEKCDGSSTTAYKWKGKFGVCSRNMELKRNPDNGYWKVALKYGLEENLPEGIALQWETCGPGIQSNPMGLKEIDGFAFSAYIINEHRYAEMGELMTLCRWTLKFPMAELIEVGNSFDAKEVEKLGEGKYKNGKQREGVVVRSQHNVINGKPLSFKVINLGYEK